MDTAQLVCHLDRTHVILPRLSLPLALAASAPTSIICNLTEKYTLKSIVHASLSFTELFVIIKNMK